jgi:hypothetical protein
LETQLYWANREHTLLVTEFSGAFDWQVYREFIEIGYELLIEKADRAREIIDFSRVAAVPIDAPIKLGETLSLLRRKSWVTIVVATDADNLTVFNLFVRLYPELAPRYIPVGSIEQAYQVLGIAPGE